MSRIRWLRAGIGLIVLLGLAGCGSPPGRSGLIRGELSSAELTEAEELYARLNESSAQAQWPEARDLAVELVTRYPGFAQQEHVLLLGAQAALELNDDELAERMLREMLRLAPEGTYAPEGSWELARLYQERGRWMEEARLLVEFDLRSGDDDPRRAQARARLRELVDDRLELEELDALAAAYPRSVVASYARFVAAERSYAAANDPQRTGERLEAFLRDYPDSRYAEEARSLLAALGREHGYRATAYLNVALPDRIGLLCPLSGEYAALGQAMFDGALLAIEENNRLTGENVQLVSRDTRGDEVVAVQMARELIDAEGCIALIGALLSPETVAVATLCQERGVPLISPTATKETISGLGDYVFQTNMTKAVETRLLARAAVEALLRRRFGILHPKGSEGEAIAQRFTDEVRSLGATVVSVEHYDRDTTDFAEILQRMRATAPEALFIPASPSEMRLIAPQLVFQDLPAQLLGVSSWNSSLLTRELGESMDRAIFPSDIALIPERERTRFETQWSRRFRESASNPFGLKSYFALRFVLESLESRPGTRLRLREQLEQRLEFSSDDPGGSGLDKLRMMDGREIVSFPAHLFPWLLTERPRETELPSDPEP
jgi:branched-chain amino acid transport system substrate-binding protein